MTLFQAVGRQVWHVQHPDARPGQGWALCGFRATRWRFYPDRDEDGNDLPQTPCCESCFLQTVRGRLDTSPAEGV